MPIDSLVREIELAGGQVFIGFKEPGNSAGVTERGRSLVTPLSRRAAREVVLRHGAQIRWESRDLPHLVANIPLDAVNALIQHPLIEYVEPVAAGQRNSQTVPWGVSKVGAPPTWSYTTGAGVKVLIVDSGIAAWHPDLEVSYLYSCSAQIPPGDTRGHGTEVAGVVAALDNALEIIGVSPAVTLLSAKDEDEEGRINSAMIACGVDFGRWQGVHVINLTHSISKRNTALTDQLNAAYYIDGIVVVCSAGYIGYDWRVTYPATLPSVIAVGATDSNDNLWVSNPWGSEMELVAPGVDVITTCVSGLSCPRTGTSYSAPHVAGAAALLKAFNPSWSAAEIRYRLAASAIDIGSSGKDVFSGWGRLNVAGALQLPPPPSYSATIHGPHQAQPGQTCYWYVSTNVIDPTVEWRRGENGPVIGSGFELFYSSPDSFELYVWVSSATVPSAAGDSRTIYVSPEMQQCNNQ